MPSDMDWPLVSVIMPCYNTALYIGESIESVLSQDYPNKELIIVDDGSTDDTVNVVREYGGRIRLLEQENQGAAAARNAGIRLAHGKYIAFIDSDDIWLQGKLSAQAAYLEAHPEISLVHCRLVRWRRDEDGMFRQRSIPGLEEGRDPVARPGEVVEDESGWIYHRLFFDPVLSTITAMMRRSLLDEIGMFDESLKRGEDYELWFRASRVTRIQMLDFIGAVYRLHGKNTVSTCPEQNYVLKVMELALERWGLTGPDGVQADPKVVKRRLGQLSFNFGRSQYQTGNPGRALPALMRSLRHHVLWPRAWVYLMLAAIRMVLQPRNRSI